MRTIKSLKSKDGKFLKDAIEKMRKIAKMTKDDFAHNLVISCLGCLYPDPSRIQEFAQPVLTEFLDKTIYKPTDSFQGKISLFPTEGTSAAIMYIFNSLKYNGLVIPGDTIGLMTPIFSPYLEIPTLANYDLKQICIEADGNNNWEIPDDQLEKIANQNMRALFLVNPTNPSAMSLSERTVKRIATIVRRSNPNIIIITDNAYAPFVGEFDSLFTALPRNTIGVYSLSKYFGTTGWRLGVIAMHDSNIIDSRLLKEVNDSVNNRYSMINLHPKRIKFIDRILIDSRQVAEAHTAGLSTPQQVFMCLCAIRDLMDTDRIYQQQLDHILESRLIDLLNPIEYKVDETPLNSNYYVVIDISKAADRLMGGSSFGNYLKNRRDPLEFLIKLAKQYGVVCLSTLGFAGPFWGIRVSLANLKSEAYGVWEVCIRDLIDEYYTDFQKWERKQDRLAAKQNTN